MNRFGIIIAIVCACFNLRAQMNFPAYLPPSAAITYLYAIPAAVPSSSTRNDYSFPVGLDMVATTNITIYQLGRWVISGNSQTHTLYLFNANSITPPTLLGSVTINTSGAPAGQFVYGTLSTPVSITSGTKIIISSSETSGGDLWYDAINNQYTFTSDFTSAQNAFDDGTGSYVLGGLASASFVPVNCAYTNP